MKETLKKQLLFLDSLFISEMHRWGIPCLRISLGIVFFWFGILKLTGHSPIESLVKNTYTFLPYPWFFKFLGIFEIIIGLGLISKIKLRITLVLLWMQLIGTFFSIFLAPSIFFQNGNPLFPTSEGEFVIKNIVLFSSGIVIGGYKLTPLFFK